MSDRVPFRLMLISTASVNEFTNSNSSFKNRLPQPIRLEGDWEVALDDISLPNSTMFTHKVNPENRMKLFDSTILRRVRNPGGGDRDRPYAVSYGFYDLATITPTVDGVGFMKTVFDTMEQKRIKDVLDAFPRFSHTVGNEEKRTYWKWKWEGDELFSDNEDTYKGDAAGRPFFLIHSSLGLEMKWFQQNEDDTYSLEPNLIQEHFDPNVIPEINGTPPHQGDVFNSATTGTNAQKYVFWTPNDILYGVTGRSNDNGYIRLSYHCNWRFININAAFREVAGSEKRTLLCYSDVCKPSTVGSQKVDLLREVTFEEGKGGTVYYESHRLQHLAVRNSTLDVISVEIAEKDGTTAKFHTGPTTVTLHFNPV